MKRATNGHYLLTVTAVVEGGTGLALMTVPSVVSTILLGATLDPPVALVVARIAGVALISLGVACWLASRDEQSRAARGLVAAMLFYNVAVPSVLVVAGLYGIGLWPVVVAHVALAMWCIACLRSRTGDTK
jgi:hypothetical protein